MEHLQSNFQTQKLTGDVILQNEVERGILFMINI